MGKQTKKNRLLETAKRMPPRHHKLPGEAFDWMKSEALKWLIEQPEILDFIWQSVRNQSGTGALITYDPDTKTWKGVDYDDD